MSSQKKRTKSVTRLANLIAFVFILFVSLPAHTQVTGISNPVAAPKFEVDPFWPKSLPNHWVFSQVGGVCFDAQNHMFVISRDVFFTFYEHNSAKLAPPVVEFDSDGNVVNSWGNRDLMAEGLHGCFVDYQGNVWIAGEHDGIVQKYTHDGSKMLLQIGTKGVFDSADGTNSQKTDALDSHMKNGAWAMNSSHVYLNDPTGVAVDPTNGDVYISDGYGNRRVVVFDRAGHFLRQWGRQGTLAEVEAGVGGVFLRTVHCVAMANDGLVYVCDREGDRIEVFDKPGNFKRNIPIDGPSTSPNHPGSPIRSPGRAGWVGFSPDPAQKWIYVADDHDSEVQILDRATGQALSSFGQIGTQAGEFVSAHMLAVDSKGDFVASDTFTHRVQIWRLVR
jgi:DNA-binding beta-propeller fold protein YncE